MLTKEYQEVLRELEQKGNNHAVIKLNTEKLTDIDVLTENATQLKEILKKRGYIEYRSEKGMEKYKSVFIKYEHPDFSTVHVHRAIAWDGQLVMKAQEVLSHKTRKNGFYEPEDEYNTAIRILHAIFENAPLEKITKIDPRKIAEGKPWKKAFIKTYETGKTQSQKITFVNLLSKNFPQALIDAINHYKNLLFRITNLRKKGITISLTGNDGCGKTTIANDLKKEYNKCLKDVKIVHMGHKPVLPTTKAYYKAAKNKPIIFNDQQNTLIKELAMAYIFIENLLRYVTNIRLPITRSKIIISDRYYYDEYLQNPYALQSKIGKCLLKLYPKPDFNIYLDCAYETITKRKGEINETEYEQRAKRLETLKKQIPCITIQNENKDKTTTQLAKLTVNKAIQKLAW